MRHTSLAALLSITFSVNGFCPALEASGPRADLSLPDPRTAPDPSQVISAEQRQVGSAMAHYMLARQFELQGRMRSALPHLKQAAELNPRHFAMVAHCAELLLQYEGRQAAVDLLKKTLERCPDEPGSHFNLIRFLSTYVSADPFTQDDALAMLQAMLKRFTARSDVLSFAVLHHLSMNQRPQAIALLESCLNQDPGWKQPKPWMELARAAQEVWPLGQPEQLAQHAAKVRPFWDRALAHAAAGAAGDEVRLEVARHLLLSNQLEAARELCEQMQRSSDNLQAAKMLHQLLLSSGDKQAAFKLHERLVAREPDNVLLRRALADEYQQRNNLKAAIAEMEIVIQRAGGDPETYQTLGQWLLKSGDYRRAIDLSQRSILLYPQEPGFRLQASFAWSAQGRWDEALEHLAAAAAIAQNGQPDLLNHRFYRHYGITLASAGRREQAARMLEKAITLTPRDESDDAANTMNYLGYLYLEDNEHLAKAGELIRKANELKPDQAAYIDSLGWWHFKKGEHQQALTQLKRALSLLKEPSAADSEILEHLAAVHLALGQHAQARQWLHQALKLPGMNQADRKRVEEQLAHLPAEPSR